MQIHRVHDEHHPFPTAGGPHLAQPGVPTGESESVEKSRPNAVSFQSSLSTEETSYLLEQLHLLPDQNDDALQLALARYRSGELFTREVAESTAISSLRDYVF